MYKGHVLEHAWMASIIFTRLFWFGHRNKSKFKTVAARVFPPFSTAIRNETTEWVMEVPFAESLLSINQLLFYSKDRDLSIAGGISSAIVSLFT